MRPTVSEMMMSFAKTASERSTCSRRSVGCVLVDKNGRVLSIGYNGVATGLPHCNEGYQCEGVNLPAGQDFCEAIHAEQNALIQCPDIKEIAICYVTLSPCRSCVKLLLNTPCREIVFANEWEDPFAKMMWVANNRRWTKL